MFDDIHEWPMVSTRGTARRGIDRREISIARSPGDSDGIRFGIRSSNANRSISSLKELHQILSGRSIMAGCLKPGARRAERLRGIKKAGARSGSMPFVSSSPRPMAILVTRPTALPRVSRPGNSGSSAIMDRRVILGSPLWLAKGSWPYTANYEVFTIIWLDLEPLAELCTVWSRNFPLRGRHWFVIESIDFLL